jgi:uncharacterized membrane protein
MTSTPPHQTGKVGATSTHKKADTQPNVGLAIIAYFLFFIPLLTEDKNDPYVKFHTKQGLCLFLTFLISSVIAVVPILGWITAPLLWVFAVILLIIGIINAATGQTKELPLIGQFARQIQL